MPELVDLHAIQVSVELGPRSYPIHVGSQGADGLGRFAREALEATWAGRSTRSALLVTDHNVAECSYLPASRSALEGVGIAVRIAVVPSGEATKCLATASTLYDELIAMKADRHSVVVALGGGVIGDLAGFVAATYSRGLPLIMCPTTLLAQVDSSVGGKVGVNHPQAKNIIGAFHQPAGVWIDTTTLDTLPPREFRCGLAEVVKYGVILDSGFFAWLERETGSILDRRPGALREIVAHSCRLKAQVVSQDEREETGLRAVLNFGHTIGHAIEAAAGYKGTVLHGEAVAAGMVAECRLAERLGWLGPDLTNRLVSLLGRFGLPTTVSGLHEEQLLEAMSRDKKNQGSRIRFVLPRTLGRVELTDAPELDDVRSVLSTLSS
jgi:3-dehydroquinate synthase